MSKSGGSGGGTIRFKEELAHGANAGLDKAVAWLEPVHKKHPQVCMPRMSRIQTPYRAPERLLHQSYTRRYPTLTCTPWLARNLSRPWVAPQCPGVQAGSTP